jgi:hypothetical protein
LNSLADDSFHQSDFSEGLVGNFPGFRAFAPFSACIFDFLTQIGLVVADGDTDYGIGLCRIWLPGLFLNDQFNGRVSFFAFFVVPVTNADQAVSIVPVQMFGPLLSGIEFEPYAQFCSLILILFFVYFGAPVELAILDR